MDLMQKRVCVCVLVLGDATILSLNCDISKTQYCNRTLVAETISVRNQLSTRFCTRSILRLWALGLNERIPQSFVSIATPARSSNFVPVTSALPIYNHN